MEFSNINNSPLEQNTPNEYVALPTEKETTALSEQKSINTTFRASNENEVPTELKKDVEYKPSQDIVQEKTEAISQQEQQRMQKLQQKELLINLQKNTSLNGSSYSRNMDEAVVMNAQKKDIENNLGKPIHSSQVQGDDDLAEKIYIDPASEELNEEFLNPQNKKKNNEKSQEEPNERKNKDKNDNKKSKNYFDFEDDEIIDIDLSILALTKQLDKKDGKEPNLSKEIERRINLFESIKNNQENPTKIPQKEINPALKKALSKNPKKKNTNKLKQKFHKK